MPVKRKKPTRPKPRARRIDVTRIEFDEMQQRLAFIDGNVKRNAENIDVQFTRIAQIQAELDEVRRHFRKTST
jgi:hypothetical protein